MTERRSDTRLLHSAAYRIAAALSALALASCVSVQPAGPDKPLPGENTDIPVSWSVGLEKGAEKTTVTKATVQGGHSQMISNMSDLQFACSPGSVSISQATGINIDKKGMGKSIGFFSEYYHPDHGISKDVFGMGATHLIYDPDGSRWKMVNENGEEVQRMWVNGGRYNIRAFYPHKIYDELPAGVEGASAKTFVVQYNTHKYQDDLMVAFNGVNTEDPGHPDGEQHKDYTDGTYHSQDDYSDGLDECSPDRKDENNNHSVKGQPSIMYSSFLGKRVESHFSSTADPEIFHYSQKFGLSEPVPLYFHHTLAAVRVIVVMEYEPRPNDYVRMSGVYLYNDHASDGIMTTGLLVYGQNYQSRGWDIKDTFTWTAFQTMKPGEHFYEWKLKTAQKVKHTDTDGQPVMRPGTTEQLTLNGGMEVFYSTKDKKVIGAIPYTNPKNYVYAVYDIDPVNQTLVGTPQFRYSKDYNRPELAWSASMDTFAQMAVYSQNDGWVMTIPQEQKGHLWFHLDITTTTVASEKTDGVYKDIITDGSRDAQFPEFTGTNKYGLDYNKLKGLTSDDDRLAAAEKELCYNQAEWWKMTRGEKLASFDSMDDFNWYIPGKRYTYIVKVRKSDVHMDVSVADWKEKYAYAEIDF